MKKEIIFKTVQTVLGESEELLHKANALIRESDNLISLEFFLNNIHHSIGLKRDDLELYIVRNHDEKNPIIYREGYSHKMLYKTPYGNMDMEFKTEEIKIEESGDELEISIKYEILNDKVKLSDNTLFLSI